MHYAMLQRSQSRLGNIFLHPRSFETDEHTTTKGNDDFNCLQGGFIDKYYSSQASLILKACYKNQIRSDQISRLVVSDSLQPHESQHARPPCPSPTPEFTQTHVHRVHDAIQPSHPLPSPSPPTPNPSPQQSLFQ